MKQELPKKPCAKEEFKQVTSDMYKIQLELDLYPETRGGLKLVGCELI